MASFIILCALFSVAFIAATILPIQSEAVLVAVMLVTDIDPWVIVGVASIGNTLGSCVNWWMGVYIEHFHDRKWFPVKEKGMAKAHAYYNKYGRWALLISWMPVFGDALTVVAGVLREKFWVFFTLVFIGKSARYVVLAWLTLKVGETWLTPEQLNAAHQWINSLIQ